MKEKKEEEKDLKEFAKKVKDAPEIKPLKMGLFDNISKEQMQALRRGK